MPRLWTAVALALAAAILALACNGDDNDRSRGETPAGTKPPTVMPQGDATGDEKTPVPEETAEQTETPQVQATPPPTAAEGRPASAPEDQSAFLARFQGQAVAEEQCAYNPGTRVTSCSGRGLYAVDPPLAGQDIACSLLLLNQQPIAIRCTSAEPLQTLYYEIEG